MKSWCDYDTTEEAFEALRIMRGGSPSADELAEKAGLVWDEDDDIDGTYTKTCLLYRDEDDLIPLGHLWRSNANNRIQYFGAETFYGQDELEAIVAKMKELHP